MKHRDNKYSQCIAFQLFYFILLSLLLSTFMPLIRICMKGTLYNGELLYTLPNSVGSDVMVKTANQD